MKVLVVGSGAREHAIVWALSRDPRVTDLCCAPGNAGIAQLARCENISATDIAAMADFAERNAVDLTFVAPDDPLALGMVDAFEAKGLKAYGPSASAARIEASKSFAKGLMKKYGIPTASYEEFDDYDEACEYLRCTKYPVVLKADGLALGKGVVIAESQEQALEAARAMMREGAFGAAGQRMIVEEFMTGREVSALAFVSGRTVLPMPGAQDYKRALDGDKGLNTGGMGAFSPSPFYTPELEQEVMERIFKPLVSAMESEGCPFSGILYAGLMLTKNGPKVVEFNARFGDPEAQVLLPRLKTPLLDIVLATLDGTLDNVRLEWDERPCVCVVLASGGYPEKYETGKPILMGIDEDGTIVFHAGTRMRGGKLETSGGRVLSVCALGNTHGEACERAYAAARKIEFDGKYMREDIAEGLTVGRG